MGGIFKWILSAGIWKRQMDKFNKQVADDVALAVQKAHLGKLPKGVYADQVIYTRKLSREQLCVPLDVDTLRRMAECTVVRRHEAECIGVDAKLESFGNHGSVTLVISVCFDGETADGQSVQVEIRQAHLLGSLERDTQLGWWTLTNLREVMQ